MTHDLKSSLKKAQPIVRQYVAELEARNAKLQHKIVKLEADKMERDHRIKAFEKELKELKKPPPEMNLPDLGEVLRRSRQRLAGAQGDPAK